MQLDSNFTKISATEQTEVVQELTVVSPRIEHRWWVAELDGISMKGEHVYMERTGGTPDAAIKNLFEAMTEQEITL